MPLEVETNTACDFVVVFSIKMWHKDVLMFCKSATEKMSLENTDSILGEVVWESMLHDTRKYQREQNRQYTLLLLVFVKI